MTQRTPEPPFSTSSDFSRDIQDRLDAAEAIEQQLEEHWREYGTFQNRLDELRTAQDDLRGIAQGVKSARSTGAGMDATIDAIVDGHEHTSDDDLTWLDSVKGIARESVGEILLNTARHSAATSANASVRRASDWLLLVLSDNGRGGASLVPGKGLALVRDGVTSAGGIFSVESPTGGGTSVTVCLPLRQPHSSPG